MLWTCSWVPKVEFDFALLSQVVGEDRRRRVESLRVDEQKWQCLIADRLVRLLARYLGLGRHTYLPTGQPVIEGGHVSAAHDTTMVVAAISDTPVGLDVVDVRRCDLLDPRHILSEAELEGFGVYGGWFHATPLQKARCWAAKEAALKRVGRGLDLDPRRLSLRQVSGGWVLEGVTPYVSPVRVAAVGSAHLLAVASDSEFILPSYIPAYQLIAQFQPAYLNSEEYR